MLRNAVSIALRPSIFLRPTTAPPPASNATNTAINNSSNFISFFRRAMSEIVLPDLKIGFVATKDAPAAIGPYSQATVVHNTVYCSGQIAFDPATMEIVKGGIEVQTQRVLDNMEAVLLEAGSDLNHVVKTNVFLKNMDDFAAMNGVYSAKFGDHRPARAAVEVARLPRDVDVEIECIAVTIESLKG